MNEEQASELRGELSYRAMAIHLPVLLAFGALWIFANEKIAFVREYGFLLPLIVLVVIWGVALVVQIRFRKIWDEAPE
jgi:hypothetical protein